MWRKYSIIALVLMSISFIFVGCGLKPGEEKAEEIVKENVRVKDSYRKVSYEVNEKAGVSKLVFRAKNLMNAELERTVYFKVDKGDLVSCIGDDSIPGIEDIYKHKPENLDAYERYYSRLIEALKKYNVEITMFLNKVQGISKNGSLNKNYFAWEDVKNKSEKYNATVDYIHLVWKKMEELSSDTALSKIKHSDSFKIYNGEKCIEAKPIKIEVEGNIRSGWHGQYEFTDFTE